MAPVRNPYATRPSGAQGPTISRKTAARRSAKLRMSAVRRTVYSDSASVSRPVSGIVPMAKQYSGTGVGGHKVTITDARTTPSQRERARMATHRRRGGNAPTGRHSR